MQKDGKNRGKLPKLVEKSPKPSTRTLCGMYGNISDLSSVTVLYWKWQLLMIGIHGNMSIFPIINWLKNLFYISCSGRKYKAFDPATLRNRLRNDCNVLPIE